MAAVLPGVKLHELNPIIDDRGFFAEIMRQDWKKLLGEDGVSQVNLSMSFPGMIRAWHRHKEGQVDYFLVVKGAMKVCAYDDQAGSSTKGQLDEVVLSSQKLQVLRVPGLYWHGTKAIGDEPSLTVYFATRLYDYDEPDEERRPWNDSTILNPRTKQPFDWNRPPHK